MKAIICLLSRCLETTKRDDAVCVDDSKHVGRDKDKRENVQNCFDTPSIRHEFSVK